MAVAVIVMMSSCAGGYTTRNGIFQDHHKGFKEKLIGDWRVANEELNVPGPTVFKFYKTSRKKVALRVNNEDVEMKYFDSNDALSFSFHYFNSEGKDHYVYCKFRNYARQELMIYQDMDSNQGLSQMKASLTPQAKFKVLSRTIASNYKDQ